MSNTLLPPTPIEEVSIPRPVASVLTSGHKREVPKRTLWRGTLLLSFVAVLAFGAGWWFASGASQARKKEVLPPETNVAERDPASVMVTVEPVTYRPVQRAVEGVGTLHGFEEISISAKVEGRVRKLAFDVADRFKPGDLLLEIDPTDSELSVQQEERALQVELAKLGFTELPEPDVDLGKIPTVMQAKTRMENAQSRYERVVQLGNSGAASREELDNTTSDFRAAEAEYANQILLARSGLATIQWKQSALAVARQELADTRIQVPTPTRPVPSAADDVIYAVTQRAVAEGTLVRPGTEVCRLVIDRTLKVRVPVPERYSIEVRLGQKAEVHTAAFANSFAGTVTRINPAVEPSTRTFEVEIQIPNPNSELKPGSFAKVAILTRMDEQAATVPLTGLVSFAGINKVFLAENGVAKEEVPVTLGVQSTEWVEITGPDLPKGAQIITSGQTVLAAGTPVAVRVARSKTASQAL